MNAPTETLTPADIAAALGLNVKTARKLFSDKGGPLYRLPHTGNRVLTTQAALTGYLEPPPTGNLTGPLGLVPALRAGVGS